MQVYHEMCAIGHGLVTLLQACCIINVFQSIYQYLTAVLIDWLIDWLIDLIIYKARLKQPKVDQSAVRIRKLKYKTRIYNIYMIAYIRLE